MSFVPLQFEDPTETLQSLRDLIDLQRAMDYGWLQSAAQQVTLAADALCFVATLLTPDKYCKESASKLTHMYKRCFHPKMSCKPITRLSSGPVILMRWV